MLFFPQLNLWCRYGMYSGSATTDGQFAYFTPGGSNSVYRYELNTEKWDQLPPSPYWNSALVIINGELTAVGGETKYRYTSRLLTLRQNQWVQHYPSMNILRSNTAVLSTSDHQYIFVIGGDLFYDLPAQLSQPAPVEVLDVKSKIWYKLPPNLHLPLDISKPSATICGNQLHVIGEHGEGYTCSLPAFTVKNGKYKAYY